MEDKTATVTVLDSQLYCYVGGSCFSLEIIQEWKSLNCLWFRFWLFGFDTCSISQKKDILWLDLTHSVFHIRMFCRGIGRYETYVGGRALKMWNNSMAGSALKKTWTPERNLRLDDHSRPFFCPFTSFHCCFPTQVLWLSQAVGIFFQSQLLLKQASYCGSRRRRLIIIMGVF